MGDAIRETAGSAFLLPALPATHSTDPRHRRAAPTRRQRCTSVQYELRARVDIMVADVRDNSGVSSVELRHSGHWPLASQPARQLILQGQVETAVALEAVGDLSSRSKGSPAPVNVRVKSGASVFLLPALPATHSTDPRHRRAAPTWLHRSALVQYELRARVDIMATDARDNCGVSSVELRHSNRTDIGPLPASQRANSLCKVWSKPRPLLRLLKIYRRAPKARLRWSMFASSRVFVFDGRI
ncbi:hypothetical protein BKA62DRAFT_778973 [Auriculariales sp. MPI-PUGE-AT-0066]|nr:hypothetical protein BKA62DRAFT_778973 [Auriculariales sp. MPI-PUGE-AT-0066]